MFHLFPFDILHYSAISLNLRNAVIIIYRKQKFDCFFLRHCRHTMGMPTSLSRERGFGKCKKERGKKD